MTKNLATLAAAATWPKCDATELLNRLHNEFPAAEPMLVELYRHLGAKAPAGKNAASDFAWVARAVSKDKNRRQLCYVYATGSYIVATNGASMHIVPDTRPTGFYDVNEQRVDVDLTFPQWERVLPAADVSDETVLHLADASHETVGKLQVLAWGDLILDAKYLKDAIGARESFGFKREEGRHTPLRIDLDAGRIVVILPMRPEALKK